MEKKRSSLPGKKGLKGFSNREKQCNKCGFVTFYLRVLYTHKYKCQGKLLGSMSCCYCKRKFNFLVSLNQHKKTCVKHNLKKKSSLKKKLDKKKQPPSIKAKKSFTSKAFNTIVCPTCLKVFPTKHLYKAHSKKGTCRLRAKAKSSTFSARKSVSNARDSKPDDSISNGELDILEEKRDVNDLPLENPLKIDNDKTSGSALNAEEGCICLWCKNVYPSKTILLKHLEENSQCAKAFYNRNSIKKSPKVTFSARKSMPMAARKSFPNSKNRIHSLLNSSNIEGSARKSLPNSNNRVKRSSVSPFHSPLKSINICPVCYEEFPDDFSFFGHQKKYNHWGKATKSTNSSCKCPFCSKEFFSVRARNAHLSNHADKSVEEIELFLKNTTCHICSQIFVSEMIKHQHIKIVHPRSLKAPVDLESSQNSFEVPSKKNFQNTNSLPLVLKQKLKLHPNTCPVCSKKFSSSQYRNKHFQEKHLNPEKKCKFCPMKFSSSDSAELHMQNSHPDSFKFKCLVCNLNLATAPDVVKHIVKRHPEEEPKKIIQCRVNESSSSDQPNIVEKSSYHSEKPVGKSLEHYCDVCNVNFQRLCGLVSHRQSKSHREMMIKSLDEMHQELSDLPPPPPVQKKPVPQPEILVCNECSSEFTSIKDFVPHRLSHFSSKYMKINELNYYTCEICNEICDSHSKAQMHLFWHLQVQSTASEKNSSKVDKKPVVSEKLSDQQFAKKSFSSSAESNQEVVIRGVKKSLFTCDACKIGFTTQASYNLHVRKFCKMKNPNSPKNNASEEPDNTSSTNFTSTTIQSDKKRKPISNVNKTLYCSKCSTFFLSSVLTTHDNFCSNSLKDVPATGPYTGKLKNNMIATCIRCNSSFVNPQDFHKHMITFHVSSTHSENTVDKTEVMHCATCSCLFFSSEIQANHELVCCNPSYEFYNMSNNEKIMKIVSKLPSVVVVCISCNEAFSDGESFHEHRLEFHKKSVGGCSSLSSNGLSTSVKEKQNNSESNLLQDTSKNEKSGKNSSCVLSQTDSEDLIKLRDNFSQLFCLLLADPELMQKLGYGVDPVDQVLINVMEQMGLVPTVNDDISELECLRKNIQIFLDFVLKDQVMQLIGNGKSSTDDIVIEALNTLKNDGNIESFTAE